ncbi:class I SAM-dependent methyltransferase [Sphingosinicella sp. LHD-64]|uniref:class I SAM-dependent methyltransferase n=1 Tax=Sphingosinicella sp. LHD-64 TaxID=3072139 RepID=UPI00280D7C8B|nr:class I SAM-dependent methyltransferase [Sphingosinicella sp. LHD-64]MDQ8757514.1 class I SAM-dependent methyltransferase [Sphingosinicella sp. LHD-64]
MPAPCCSARSTGRASPAFSVAVGPRHRRRATTRRPDPMKFDPGSFRDPSGRILVADGRIFRAVFGAGLDNFEGARTAGVYTKAIARGRLVPMEEREPGLAGEGAQRPYYLLEHPPIDFISYPYEWTFSALKAAALLHLDFHLELLADGFTLSDATAYNIQFNGTRPTFIDHLSVVHYADGSPWTGQRQFAMQFLNPLLLWTKRGLAPNAWFRGSGEGLAPEDVAPLMRVRDKLSFTVLAHVIGPSMVHKRRIAQGLDDKAPRAVTLPKKNLVAILTTLRSYIAGLDLPGQKTIWSDYAGCNSYGEAQRAAKHDFVARQIATLKPDLLFDLGCNSGDFSRTALDSGARSVVGFDFDFGALEHAFARFDADGGRVLPLWLDATNPSPSQGWAGAERKSLGDRGGADALLALAIIHHLAIARNVPLDMAVDWLMGMAPAGVIEFPSKGDPMVTELLRGRPDIFPDYSEEAFLAHVSARGAITEKRRLGEGGRLMVAYDRRHRG